MKFRVEEDTLGMVRVPSGAYYGAFTVRATKQYTVTGYPAHKNLIAAFVMIKRSAAIANVKTKSISAKQGRAIISACDNILAGRYADQFVVDMINSGAGTAFNMNVNEVIANVALESMHKKKGEYSSLHPNDHVNMSQSSNDTYPTAMHVSILNSLKEVLPAVDVLSKSLAKKAKKFASFKKIGRTHLMDALPITLGGEFAAYSTAMNRARSGIVSAQKQLYHIPLGATAVGSGANTPRGYRKIAIAELAKISRLPLLPEKDMQYGLQSRYGVALVSASLRGLAVELGKIANDIRLMASGPVAGFGELCIPAVHAGSSIMPGKVNPSLAECMNMICYNIMGNDITVNHAAQAGQFELNVMLPGMLKCVLESADMISGFVPVFATNLIDGLISDRKKLCKMIEASPVLVTLLAPKIGYQKSAALFKESLSTGKTIRELAVSGGLLTGRQADALFG
ncbi:MAG: aspartate ammonia-lyase [Nitrosopumilus sp. D6]|nr:MAG: aspartate ammonia-lyase [Nitrosopumilus sp. D6]